MREGARANIAMGVQSVSRSRAFKRCGFAALRAVRLCLTMGALYCLRLCLRRFRGAASRNEAATRKGRAFPHGRRQSRKPLPLNRWDNMKSRVTIIFVLNLAKGTISS